MTMDDLRQGLRAPDIIKNVRQQEFGQRMQVTEEEDRPVLQHQHKSDFMRPATVTLREISCLSRAEPRWRSRRSALGMTTRPEAKIDALKARAGQG